MYESPLLVAKVPFAGLKQTFNFGSFSFSAQQAIPSNNHLAKRIGTIETGTPSFRIETLSLKLGKKHTFKMDISHFSFRDLSSGISEKSKVLGNSVEGNGAGSRFTYGFDGYNLAFNTSFILTGYQLELGGHYLYNEKAPEKRNRGHLVFLALKGNQFGASIEQFRNESDSSPAFYNNKNYGHNNMSGQALILSSFGKEYLGQIRIAQFSPIKTSALQDQTNLLSFQISKTMDF